VNSKKNARNQGITPEQAWTGILADWKGEANAEQKVKSRLYRNFAKWQPFPTIVATRARMPMRTVA